MASCTATKEAVWLSRLVADMHGTSEKTVIISLDNQGAIDTTRKQAINKRNEHIDIQIHYVRDMVELKRVDFKYCATDDMTADTLTKALDKVKFAKHKCGMSVGPA